MNAKDIMSSPIVFTQGKLKLASVKALFTKDKISSAPVLNDNEDIEGIITSSDVSAIHNENLLVRDVMTHKVHVCALNARVKDIAKIMTKEQIHHIVVMDDGKVQGMISSLDVIEAMLNE